MSDTTEKECECINPRTKGHLMPRPKKDGYVFSHWSLNKPGSGTTVRREDGTVAFFENDCPPFDFSKSVITEDTKLYAIFIPELTVTFMDGDVELGKQNTVYGGKAFDPTPDAVRCEYEGCHHC